MKRSGKSRADERYLKQLGRQICKTIKSQGYESPYDFWIEKADGHFARSTLNAILAGKMDPKITTIKAIAKLLRVDPKELI